MTRQPQRRPAAAARPRPDPLVPLGSIGPIALFDLPWMPFYLAICFAVPSLDRRRRRSSARHPGRLTLMTEFMTRAPVARPRRMRRSRNTLAEASRRNAEVLQAMGMAPRIAQAGARPTQNTWPATSARSDVAGGLGAVSKVLRMMLQSAVLGVGAYLVINQEATAGIIIAGSILRARALAPVDLAIAQLEGLRRGAPELGAAERSAAISCRRVEARWRCRRPRKRLSVESVSVVPPGEQSRDRAGRHLRARRPAAASASSARAPRASRRSCARSSASGRRRAARCGSTARRSTSGRRTCSAGISAICRRTSSCSTARLPRISPASSPTRAEGSSRPPRRPACTT